MKTNTTNTKPAYEPNLSERLHGLRKAVEDTLAAKEHEDSVASEMHYYYSRRASREEEQRQQELQKWKSFAMAAYESAIAHGAAINRSIEGLKSKHEEMIAVLEKEEDEEQIPF
jgi:hypothetical protein